MLLSYTDKQTQHVHLRDAALKKMYDDLQWLFSFRNAYVDENAAYLRLQTKHRSDHI